MANEVLGTATLTAIDVLTGRVVKGLGAGGSPTVTYKRTTALAFDPTATNANTRTTDDQSLAVTVITTKSEGEPAVGGKLAFFILFSDFETAYSANVTPSEGDRITHLSKTYEVSAWAPDPIEMRFNVMCKRVG